MHESEAGIIQALSLPGEAAAILLVVGQDMDHGFALVGQLTVERVQVTENVHKRTTTLFALVHAYFQSLFLLKQLRVLLPEPLQLYFFPCIQGSLWLDLQRHIHLPCPRLSLSSSCRSFSISFSNAIILSSRPTTTSSNFSRSRIFSCNSALDTWRSRTTFS